MEIGLHNTAIKKNASEILQTNSIQDVPFTVDSKIQPTIEILPNLIFRQSTANGPTMFTTPSDKDFYLTNVAVSGAVYGATAANAQVYIQANPKGADSNVSIATIYITAAGSLEPVGGQNSLSIQFPGRGLLLERNTTITMNGDASSIWGMMAGYIDAGRS